MKMCNYSKQLRNGRCQRHTSALFVPFISLMRLIACLGAPQTGVLSLIINIIFFLNIFLVGLFINRIIAFEVVVSFT